MATTRDFAIGRRGDLLYHISDDLKRFKALTMGHPIIMGRKTFESFPKGALPGRRNIVITRNPAYSAWVWRPHNIRGGAGYVPGLPECFVIGGGEIYRQALPLASKIELTLIDDAVPDADTWFLVLSKEEWGFPESPVFDRTDPRTGVSYAFLTLFPSVLGQDGHREF